MTTINNEKLVKISKQFNCELCNYSTSRKYNFDLHINSNKHKTQSNTTQNNNSLVKISKIHKCLNCDTTFNDRAGLWRHKQKCNVNSVEETKDKKDELAELVKYLVKENSEMKNMMMEVIKNGTIQNSHNTTNNNSHNKAFNLNFFLNETCKDAMNIMDFVDSIKLQLSDLERVGEVGYIEGISNIIVKNLKDLDVTQRPVHCTDKKRETIYIKDDDKWEKDENKATMHKVIKKVTTKNQRLIQLFKEAHPDYGKASSKFSDQYNKIIVESMGGHGDNDYEKEEKIIAKVSKEVIIAKETSL